MIFGASSRRFSAPKTGQITLKTAPGFPKVGSTHRFCSIFSLACFFHSFSWFPLISFVAKSILKFGAFSLRLFTKKYLVLWFIYRTPIDPHRDQRTSTLPPKGGVLRPCVATHFFQVGWGFVGCVPASPLPSLPRAQEKNSGPAELKVGLGIFSNERGFSVESSL